jgi:hypothetical protein
MCRYRAGSSAFILCRTVGEVRLLPIQHLAPSRRKIFASSVDVERQHGERGPMGIGFAPSAAQRRAAQRRGNAPGIFPGEYASIEVKRVTFLRDAC